MKKYVIGALLVFALLGVGVWFVLAPASATPAVLYIESGIVEVNVGRGWVQGTNEMELPRGASVKTKAGEATVVFFEGEMLSLQPNTEVVLEKVSSKSVAVSQLAGETWSKVTRLSGIAEYSVKTPSTVATVRGTEFFLSDEELEVADGAVDYGTPDDPQKMKVRKFKRALKGKFVEEDMPVENRARMKKYAERSLRMLSHVRERELRKHKFLLDQAKQRGLTEDQMRQQMTEIDEGRMSEDELYEKTPLLLRPKAKRALMLTKEIKKVRQRMKEFK